MVGMHDKIAGHGLRLPVADRRDIGKKPVATAGNGFDETGILGGVAEGDAEAIGRRVQPPLKIHENIRGPQTLPQFFAGHELARPFQQGLEHLKRFVLEPQLNAVLAQLARVRIELEYTEANATGPIRVGMA